VKRYSVYITPGALAEAKSLPGHVRQRVRRIVDSLADEPRPASSQSLRADLPAIELRRVRINRWRIVHSVSETESIVDVLAVRRRPPYDYGDLGELLTNAGLGRP